MKRSQHKRGCLWKSHTVVAILGVAVGLGNSLAGTKPAPSSKGGQSSTAGLDASAADTSEGTAAAEGQLTRGTSSGGGPGQEARGGGPAFFALPLFFEPNHGQTDPRVKFVARGPGYTLFLRSEGAVLSLRHSRARRGGADGQGPPAADTQNESVLQAQLVGANPLSRAVGAEPLLSKSHYFLGSDPSRWQLNIPNYTRVRYEQVYPGIDLVYYGSQGQLEADFVIAPGARPEQMVLELQGAEALNLDTSGDLVVHIAGGTVRFAKPFAYQNVRGPHHPIPVRYILRGTNRVGLEIARYDPTQTLVIDPVLSYSTYLGGSSEDAAAAVTVDSTGNVYVTGSTGSLNFPTQGPVQNVNKGAPDVFVAKLAADGSGLLYSTYLGGMGFDQGTGIAVDSSGNVYVTGCTSSVNFPTKGALQAGNAGKTDVFVAKLNSSGSELAYSTYLGGGGDDYGRGIAVDSSGSAYVVGETGSTDFRTQAALYPSNAGGFDAFVAKLNLSGSALTYSTYLGGSGADYGLGIALDSSNNAYLTGYTLSADFPTRNPLYGSHAGNTDAFLAKLAADGASLSYSTYLGGSGFDKGLAIAVDTAGNAYVTGETDSADFPTMPGALQTEAPGNGDAFVVKLNEAGSGLAYSTYLGGIDSDRGRGIAVNASGNAFATGYTRSNDFPVANALQSSFGGGTCELGPCPDAFVAELAADGSALTYSSFLGGSRADEGKALGLDSSGNAYIAGRTNSSDFPATPASPQTTYGGGGTGGDAFVAKIAPSDAPAVVLAPLTLTFAEQVTETTSQPKTLRLANYGSGALGINSIETSGDFAQTNDCGGSLAPGGAACTISVTFTPTETGERTGAVTITSDAAGSPHVVTLTGAGAEPGPVVSLSPTGLAFADQIFETTSDPQTVTLTNTGTATLVITTIETTGDFAQTQNCPTSLAPTGSCEISVTFTPATTGNRTGSLKITDNAPGSPHSVTLSGTGLPVFAISADPTSVTLTRDTSSTTFKISASAPESFTASISLSCSGEGSAVCSFNPASIKAGETSTLSVSGIPNLTEDTLEFSVTGTSGAQSASVSLAIILGNFSLSATPPLITIAAGESAAYQVTVTPTNAFNGTVSLSCGWSGQGLKETTCTVTPSAVTLDGTNSATATLTVKTTARSLAPPRGQLRKPTAPSGWRGREPLVWLPWVAGMSLLMGLILLGRDRRRARAFRLASLTAILCFVFLWVACETYYYDPYGGVVLPPGTPPGNGTVMVVGTATGLTHSVTVNLSVT